MEIKITNEKHDKFLERKIINFSVRLDKNEKIDKNLIKSKLMEGYKEGFPILYSLKSTYGTRDINGILHIYSNEEIAKSILPKYVLVKNGVITDAKGKESK